jgi:hypothetical protein
MNEYKIKKINWFEDEILVTQQVWDDLKSIVREDDQEVEKSVIHWLMGYKVTIIQPYIADIFKADILIGIKDEEMLDSLKFNTMRGLRIDESFPALGGI